MSKVDETIDIENIQEVSIVNSSYKPTKQDMKFISEKFNELIRAIKQLNRDRSEK